MEDIAITLILGIPHGCCQLGTLVVDGEPWNNSERHGSGLDVFDGPAQFADCRTYLGKVENPEKIETLKIDKFFSKIPDNDDGFFNDTEHFEKWDGTRPKKTLVIDLKKAEELHKVRRYANKVFKSEELFDDTETKTGYNAKPISVSLQIAICARDIIGTDAAWWE